MQIITFDDTTLHLQEHPKHEFLLTNKEVALGYGVSRQIIDNHKRYHADELIEGKHWLRLEVQTKGGRQKVIHWTKRGIIRLGFFIKSERAKTFRDFIEDLTLSTLTGHTSHRPMDDNLNARINGYKGMLARKNNEIEQLKRALCELIKERNAKMNEHNEAARTHNQLMDLVYAVRDQEHAIQSLANELAEMAREIADHAAIAKRFSENVFRRIAQTHNRLTK